MAERLRIVLAGGLASMPFAGVAWQVLHHLEGLRRLGHHVLYLEDTERWPYDPIRNTICDDVRPAVSYLDRLLGPRGYANWAYRDVATGEVYGIGKARLAAELASAEILINLSAVMVLREAHLQVPVRIYLETDPVLAQLEIDQGHPTTTQRLADHTHHFTYGTNFGAVDCRVPLGRFHYHTTVPPVIIDWWDEHADEVPEPPTRRFTTVANWRQTTKNITHRGELLTWSKDEPFLALGDLPQRVPVPLELALATDDTDAITLLRTRGWKVRKIGRLSRDTSAYRRYVRGSAGEFSVAKAQNTRLRSGWFSDRTATYLAAGRPAVLQDTGFGAALPTGAGLLPFASTDGAREALEQVNADYSRHARAAQELAVEHLRAELVLGRLLAGL